jgi:hypothetical protein
MVSKVTTIRVALCAALTCFSSEELSAPGTACAFATVRGLAATDDDVALLRAFIQPAPSPERGRRLLVDSWVSLAELDGNLAVAPDPKRALEAQRVVMRVLRPHGLPELQAARAAKVAMDALHERNHVVWHHCQ